MLTCRRWNDYAVVSGAYAKSRLCDKSINGNKFPHGGFESDGDFSPLWFGVSDVSLVGRHMHTTDRGELVRPLVSYLRC